ncbi:MAG: CAP domain-containing protein [Candidatus Micrarchaeaceae archaeon]
MGIVADIILLVLIVIVVAVFWPKISAFLQIAGTLVSNKVNGYNFSFPNSSSAALSTQLINDGPLVNYTLALINKDRETYNLSNVTLSQTASAQQHADSMMQYDYFSHWDIYGMKPYMRYTLVGGTGAMQENIAYMKSGIKTCIGSLCTVYGNLNITAALQQMEYNMMYNDSVCCNNGHRDNILDGNHDQVSIGIAYNSTSAYLVEDFINNYITWLNDTPKVNGSKVTLEGSVDPGYNISTIEVTYDPPVSPMSVYQLDNTSDYSYGQAIAGVVGNPLDYYPSLSTIVADTYYTRANDFLVSFDISKLTGHYGAGEYTIALWLNGTYANSSFLGSTYTIFINSNGTAYTPSNV